MLGPPKVRAGRADKESAVPTKTKKASERRQPSAKPSAPPIQIVVRRGALKRFDSLKQATAELPVTLTWDRRLAERRSPADTPAEERRTGDRRQKPQFTWELADFVVIEPTADDRAPAPKTRKRR